MMCIKACLGPFKFWLSSLKADMPNILSAVQLSRHADSIDMQNSLGASAKLQGGC